MRFHADCRGREPVGSAAVARGDRGGNRRRRAVNAAAGRGLTPREWGFAAMLVASILLNSLVDLDARAEALAAPVPAKAPKTIDILRQRSAWGAFLGHSAGTTSGFSCSRGCQATMAGAVALTGALMWGRVVGPVREVQWRDS